MAKTVTCAFCGAPLTKGLIRGTARGLSIADGIVVHCCESCLESEKALAKLLRPRFTAKLENCKWENGVKFTEAQIMQMYRNYAKECASYLEEGLVPSERAEFYSFDKNGRFGWMERKVGRSADDASHEGSLYTHKQEGCDTFGFTKDDISCIEFRLNRGERSGLFKRNYSVEICLNHEDSVSFRPCYGITVVQGSGVMFGYRHSARKRADELLRQFKNHIGSELPVREVRNFR